MNARAKKIIANLNRAPEVVSCCRHTPDWLPLSLCYLGLRSLTYPFSIRLRGGRSFVLADFHDVVTWWQIFYRRIYPVRKTDRIIIDAGANIGAFTLYALSLAPQATVVAIEPFPATFSRLQAAIDSFQCSARVELVNAALGSHSGSVDMQQDEMGSQFRRVVRDGVPQNVLPVPACTLAEVLSAIEGDIDFLKLDIEGSEYSTLLSCPIEALRRVNRLAMEFHPLYTPNAPQPQQILRYLESAGLETEEVQDHGEGYGMAYLRRKIT